MIQFETPYSQEVQYYKWLIVNYPKKSDLETMEQKFVELSYQPLISIIVPVYNPKEMHLRGAIESVLQQVYPKWELCISDDASTEPYVKSVLSEYEAMDSRIKVVYRKVNGHISHASNSALEVASGEFISLLDHDDALCPHALFKVVGRFRFSGTSWQRRRWLSHSELRRSIPLRNP